MAADPTTSPRLSEDEVSSRFEWAVRQGAPYWLWPDTAIADWQNALFEIERVTREILCTGRCDDPLRGEADDVGIAAYTSGMGPLLSHWISAGLLHAPAATADVLAIHYRHNSVRMERLAARCADAVAHLTGAGVEVTVLKGMNTAFTCFPTPGTRPTSDIDLMIASEDRPAAERILRDLDYRPEHATTEPDQQFWRHASSSSLPQSLSYDHQDDPWGIDLHTSANRRYARGAPLIRLDALVRDTALERWPLCQDARTLPPAADLLFLACHASCNFGNLRMLRLVELVLAIRSGEARPGWCWDQLVELGLRTGTLSSAYPALALADALVPGTVPADVLSNCRKDAPEAVVRVVSGLTPATAQTIRRCSMRERYMWTTSASGRIAQLLCDIFPANQPLGTWVRTLKIRLWRVLRGRVTLSSSVS